ncbi:MAG: hypothetical protein IJU96_10995 [Clostridia bacterium]|nr:hypothetical protein [Clostridia bacterium]
MRVLTETEMRDIEAGKASYWYYTGGMADACTCYAYASNYFAEPAAALRIKAHRTFCSLCRQGGMMFSYSKPRNKSYKV